MDEGLRWHKFPINCTRCKETGTVVFSSPSFSSDGRVLMTGKCNKCGKAHNWIKTWEEIIHKCRIADFADFSKAPHFVPQANSLIN